MLKTDVLKEFLELLFNPFDRNKILNLLETSNTFFFTNCGISKSVRIIGQSPDFVPFTPYVIRNYCDQMVSLNSFWNDRAQ